MAASDHSKFKVLTFEMTSEKEMLDETRSKPIQHENCVERAWKCCMKCETNGPVLLHRNIHFTETPHIYICILNFRTPLPSLKGGFPLGEMNGDFAEKFIWACVFLFVCSLAGKIFLFKIVKMNLINSRREKSPQLPDQSKYKFSTLSSNKFPSDQIEDGC